MMTEKDLEHLRDEYIRMVEMRNEYVRQRDNMVAYLDRQIAIAEKAYLGAKRESERRVAKTVRRPVPPPEATFDDEDLDNLAKAGVWVK